jgi:hypothetical protein
LPRVAEAVGARRSNSPGPRRIRKWLSKLSGTAPTDDDVAPLEWWEVPFITGLPTLIERSLLSREMVFTTTGEPGWVMRIGPNEMRQVTNALVADVIARQSHRVS